MKHKHFNKKLMMCSIFLGSGILGGRITETVFQISRSNFVPAEVKSIPKEWLDIDPDGATLNGFRPSITVEDVALGGYNTLTIPPGITTIKDYAFAYIFDGRSCDVNRIILDLKLEHIGNAAFINNFGIVDIEWNRAPNIKIIDSQAFSGCDELSRAPQFTHTLTTLGDNAFYSCSKMVGTLTLPSSLINVGTRVFYNCNKIAWIDLSDYSYIPEWIYRFRLTFANVGSDPGPLQPTVYVSLSNNSLDEWTDLLKERHTLSDNFVIQSKLTLPHENLDIDAMGVVQGFKSGYIDWSKYNYISFPQEAVKIKEGAFNGLITTPITLEISDQIQEIGKKAFCNCTGITKLQISVDEQTSNPSSLKTIDEEAFSGCANISGDVVLPKSLESINKKAFYECTSIRSVSIPNSVTTMGKNAFAKCSNLSIVDIHTFEGRPDWETPDPDKPDDYKEEEKIFKHIAPFGIILVNQGIKQLKDPTHDVNPNCPWNWFAEWYGLKDELEAQMPEIDDSNYWTVKRTHTDNSIIPEDKYSFYDITTYGFNKNVKIPEDLLIHDFIELPARVTKIADQAFANVFSTKEQFETDQVYCWYLKPMPGLQYIGNEAFLNDSYLSGILSFPQTLEYIGDYAFCNCQRLRGNLTLPDNIKYVGDGAFKNCIMMNGDLHLSNLDEVGGNIISNTNFSNIWINAMPHHIKNSAFMGDVSLKNIYINFAAPTPDESYDFGNLAFMLPSLGGGGTIHLSSSGLDLEAWTIYLHEHGLPSTWDVQQE